MCRNIWLTRLRSKKRFIIRDIIADGKEGVTDSLRIHMEDEEQRYIYLKSFKKLSNENRKILGLYFDGTPMKEIANKMGYTEVNIRKKKFRAKNQLIAVIQSDPMYQELEYFRKIA